MGELTSVDAVDTCYEETFGHAGTFGLAATVHPGHR